MTKMRLAVETGTGQLESFANVAGMTTADFKKAFKEDLAGAITAFITGLGKVNETGDSAIKVLTEMDITEIRMRDALLRASGASKVLISRWISPTPLGEENTALTKEAARGMKQRNQNAVAKEHADGNRYYCIREIQSTV